MPDFTWLDYAIMGIITVSLAFGLFRGFLREVISLVSLVLSVVLAVKCAPLLGAEFTWWQSQNVRYLVAFLIIFLAVLVIGFFIGKLCKKIAKSLGLAWLDRSLGALFGALRGSLVVLVVLFVAGGTGLSHANWYQQSKITPEFSLAMKWMDDSFPNHMKAKLGSLNRLKAEEMIQSAQSELKNKVNNVNINSKEQ